MDAAYPSSWFGESMRQIKPNQMVQQLDDHTIPTVTTTTTAPASTAVVQTPKKKRNPPATPNPDAEVVALSPRTLTATNRFICEVCNKGFQREQNLQLHMRGHNLPWKLKQKTTKDAVARKKVYLCPEPTCVNHDPSRALGDLTGIKKHYFRKHGEKKWKCDRCSKRYAVRSDWKAHSKICGTKEYRCVCGTLFSRRDSFVTHRTFCEALTAESSARRNQTSLFTTMGNNHSLLGNLRQQPPPPPAQTLLHQFPPLQQPKPIFTQQDTSQLGFHQNHETLTSFPSNPPPVHNQEYLQNLGYFLPNNNSSHNSNNIVDQNLGFLSPDQFSNMVFPNNVGLGPNLLEQQGNNNNQIPHLDEQILWSSVLGQRQDGDFGEFLKGKNVVMNGTDKKLTLDFLGVGGMMRNDVRGGGGGYSGRAQEQYNISCFEIDKKSSPPGM